MTNHMEEVAKILDLELGEEFKIKRYTDNDSSCYRITLNGLEFKTSASAIKWFKSHDDTFHEICTGNIQIAKLPFKPKVGEKYWYVCWVNEPPYVDWTKCVYSSYDYGKINLGNCFRTQEEAEANKFKIYERLTGKPQESEKENGEIRNT